MMSCPTQIQFSYLKTISQYILENKMPPTIRELGFIHKTTPKAVYFNLCSLRKKGFITWESKKARTIKIIKDK